MKNKILGASYSTISLIRNISILAVIMLSELLYISLIKETGVSQKEQKSMYEMFAEN